MERRLAHVGGEMRFVRSFDGRLAGQTWETPFIPVPSGRIGKAQIGTMIENFHTAYAARTGNRFDGLPVQGVTFRVEAVFPTNKVDYPTIAKRRAGSIAPTKHVEVQHLYDRPLKVAVYERAELLQGDFISGPAIIREPMSTTFMLPEQTLTVGQYGELRIRKGV
jgi:N-methylhydantoinase A